ncbi:MFS transporter [Solihabitans fulvus]|uniref:MFS transporter n=2 Tax=Solihabitans fulvus TaxID=1892852 RepID=A0A5B2X1Q1_9PSEU|nr:MFS transporter [Solihabitans fulvus]
MVYETARSATGPLLASLGASAVLVGVVSGVGEGSALLLRLFTGPLADRTRAYWRLALTGYGMTVVSVPLLAFAPIVGGPVGLVAAAVLLVTERVGKAVRTPSRDVLIATAGRQLGAGRAFAVHQLFDQIGAAAGPLLLAGTAALTGNYTLGFALLALPGAAALALLLAVRRAGRAAIDPELPKVTAAPARRLRLAGLPADFRWYLLFVVLSTLGFTGFGLLSFNAVHRGLASVALVPVGYAAAMLVDAGSAVLTGLAFDRIGRRVLFVLPPLAVLVPLLGLSGSFATALAGVLLWGFLLGVQESTLRAAVATAVPAEVRGAAYGLFGAVVGGATALGGVLGGALYSWSVPALVAVVAVLQAAALFALVISGRRAAV